MGVVITGLALGITIATVFTPDLIDLGGKVFAHDDAWRMAFLVLGAVTLVVGIGIGGLLPRARSAGCRTGARCCDMAAFAAVGLAGVMAIYFVGDAAGLSDLGSRRSRSASRSILVARRVHPPRQELAPCCARATWC